ncbi:hypothetical protein FQ154_09610 [Paeniglutamicibacter gangotriensis]|uniref:Uncharacterized protein n=1 Tax=Paeniglutamicibacter gangotriensis TaxID=254787 RepID=A0A5B0EG54_9MICC|nr:hypothetical protein [Paeniglutamicibacter gangotriensis]KAA0977145.1 hypothetical protein FQ154_09610 [Paeniglutamicibacter gangotriensis]
MDDWIITLITAGVGGALGIIGTLAGQLISASTARTNNLFQWNKERLSTSLDYYSDVAESVNGLYISMGVAVGEFQSLQKKMVQAAIEQGAKPGDFIQGRASLSPEMLERVQVSTALFRSSHARGLVYADKPLSDSLTKFDNCRANLVEALSTKHISDAEVELEIMSQQLKPLYSAIQYSKVEHNLVAVNTLFPWSARRQLRKQFVEEMNKLKPEGEDA